MRVKNQVFIRRPWLFPALTTIGFAFGIFGTDNNLGPWVSAAVFVGCVVVVNLWFFRSLRQTRGATAAEGRKT